MGNPFIHIELQTGNTEEAKRFYGELLSWKMNDMEVPGFGTYTLLDVGEGTGGGIMKSPVPGAPPAWLAYIEVDRLDDCTQRAEKLGAKVLQPRTEVPGFGFFVVIQDPTGAVVGLYETAPR